MVHRARRRLKVAQVITRMDWGGSPDIVRLVCLNLDKSRYEIKVIYGKSRDLTPASLDFLKGLKGSSIQISYLRRCINPLFDIAAFIRLFLIFKREKFDIIHLHTAKAGFLGRLAAKAAGCRRVIYMSHGHLFYGYFNNFFHKVITLLEWIAAKFTDTFIALTELEKEDFLKRGIGRADSIKVVPSGIDIGQLPELSDEDKRHIKRGLGIAENIHLVGMAARLEPVKGADYFVEAGIKVSKIRQDVVFLIAGDGSLFEELRERVFSAGVDEHFIFCGWRKDSLEIISTFDVLVQPSRNEAVGRALLEAQGLGVPVAASRAGGIPEIIKDGETGYLFSKGDADELVKIILKLIDDKKLRQRMAEAGRKWVRDNFSSQAMIAGIEQIYLG